MYKDPEVQQSSIPTQCIRPSKEQAAQPKTAAMAYCMAQRPKVMQENPGLSYREVARICMQRWAALSVKEKRRLESMQR